MLTFCEQITEFIHLFVELSLYLCWPTALTVVTLAGVGNFASGAENLLNPDDNFAELFDLNAVVDVSAQEAILYLI